MENIEIPENWEYVKLRDIFSIGSGKDYKHLGKGDIPVYGTGGFMTSVDEYLYDGESVGIGRKGTIDKPVFLDGKFWTVDTLFYTHSFKNTIPYFVYILFQNIDWRSYNEATGVPSLSKLIIEKIPVLLPPLPEQKKIASILSTVDAKLEKITAQIDKTQELKKGLSQRLLTRGIGHTEFKESKIGEVPVSWEVVELSNYAKVSVGIASSATHAYTDKGVPLLRNQNIKEGYINDSDLLYVTEGYENLHKTKRLKKGDILTTRTGYPGISSVIPDKYEDCQSFTTLIIRPNHDLINNFYLCYFINSEMGKSFFNSNQIGGGQKNVGAKSAEKLILPLPSFKEQTQIASILSIVDQKLSILERKKSKVAELKKGLMQGLLSGKVRV